MSQNKKSDKDKEIKKFIILFDTVGKVLNKNNNILGKIRKFGRDDHVEDCQVLRGMLFKEMADNIRTEDEFCINLESIEKPNHILKITRDQVQYLAEDDFQILCPVGSALERYDLFTERCDILQQSKEVIIGTSVLVQTGENKECEGTLRYRGLIKKNHGIYFGVELIKPHGDCNGTYNSIPHFECKDNHGIFVPVSKIIKFHTEKLKKTEKYNKQKSDKEKEKNETAKNKRDADSPQIGTRVIAIIDRKSKGTKDKLSVVHGTLKYVGEPEKGCGIVVGIELDKAFKGEKMQTSYRGKKLFNCETEKYFLSTPECILPEDQYKPEQGDIAEAYVIMTHEEGNEVSRQEGGDAAGTTPSSSEKEQEENLRKTKKNPNKNPEGEPKSYLKQISRPQEASENAYFDETNTESKLRSDQYKINSSKINNLKKDIGIDNQSFQKMNNENLNKESGQKKATKLLMNHDPQKFLRKSLQDTDNDHSNDKEKIKRSYSGEDIQPFNHQNFESTKNDMYKKDEPNNENKNSTKTYHPANSFERHISDQMSDVSDYTGRDKDGIFDRNDKFGKPELYLQKESKIPENPRQTFDNVQHSSRNFPDSDKIHDERKQREVLQSADAKHDNYDPALQVGSVVQVNIGGAYGGKPVYGVIRWKGYDKKFPNAMLAGLELEESIENGTDGTFAGGQRYFTCPKDRGFFCKLSKCKPDERFGRSYSLTKSPTTSISRNIESVEGNIPPAEQLSEKYLGRDRGIQGHHNSCYLDATLFAMFSFSSEFDSLLFRKKRANDIKEYEVVQKILRAQIVNPLRKNGFVDHYSVMELRKYLNDLGNIGGFLDEEKDPEEFVNLLFEKVLKVDPFVKLKHNGGNEESHLYQIFTERNEANLLPSIQHLFETSFLTSNLQLHEIPSVMILQMPRFGLEKLYKRIEITPTLDITSVLSDAQHQCFICGNLATMYCRDCSCESGWDHVFVFYCMNCHQLAHQHPKRYGHQAPRKLSAPNIESVISYPSIYQSKLTTQPRVLMELFAVVCIKTSHYVSFAKCGTDDNENWVFFDSMADRHGGQNGYNIPEVTEINELKQYLGASFLKIAELRGKSDERLLRLYEDASLCFYRNKDLAMYK